MGCPVKDRIIGRLIRGRSTNLRASIDEDTQFTCVYREDIKIYIVTDTVLRTRFHLPLYKTENPRFNVAQWYRRCIQQVQIDVFDELGESSLGEDLCHLFETPDMDGSDAIGNIELYHAQFMPSKFSAIQKNTAVTRDFKHTIPKPIVVVAHVNGQPVQALIDTGSLADFVSLTLVEQL